MEPEHPLPLPPHFASLPSSPSGPSPTDAYISSLLRFGTTSTMLRTLCGGVHILDFFTRTPDLYSQVLPASWRAWFRGQSVERVLDFLMRDDVSGLDDGRAQDADADADAYDADEEHIGRDEDPRRYDAPSAPPPPSLVRFVKDVRMHLLDREWREPAGAPTHRLPRPLALGMKVKKLHEVEHFAAFVDRLAKDISSTPVEAGSEGTGAEVEGKKRKRRSNEITHVADFGSGQNYLGRALACPPYNRNIIAIESREHNIAGAREIDVLAKLAPKKVVWRNKKAWKKVKDDAKARGEKVKWNRREEMRQDADGDENEEACEECGINGPKEKANGDAKLDEATPKEVMEKAAEDLLPAGFRNVGLGELAKEESTRSKSFSPNNSYTKKKTTLEVSSTGRGSIQYVTHRLEDGNLSNVIGQILDPSKVDQQTTAEIKEAASSTDTPLLTSSPSVTPTTTARDPGLMVISLHSCGNLLHHGLRSLTLNPSVRAVAMIGCCYNLLTERLGPPSYKLPQLRPNHPRLEATANAHDPHGFPMSARYAAYRIPSSSSGGGGGCGGDTGVRLNITARMMAVQAPQNWGPRDSDAFFTRHFYRALLQRVLLERGIVEAPRVRGDDDDDDDDAAHGHDARYYVVGGRRVGGPVSPAGTGDESGDPLVIGTLPKSCYRSFVAYVRGAVAKMLSAPASASPYPTTTSKAKDDDNDDDSVASPSASQDERKRLMAERMTAPALSDADIAAYEAAYAERKKELSIVWSLMAFAAGVVEAMIVVDRYCWLREQEGVSRVWVQTAFEYGLSPRNLVVVGVKG